jgi:hypothetical protein
MGRDTNAGRVGCSGNSGRGGRCQEGRGRGASATVSRKTSEVGACKDLKGQIFTIGSGNKGKDGNMLRNSMEKMATCIGTEYGDEASQEWTSGKKITHSKPAYSQALPDRHAARVKTTREQIKLRLNSLRAEKTAIEAKINQVPTNHGLLKELQEVDDQIARSNIELNDEVEMKLTDDEKTAHSNAWRTHQEKTESLKKSRCNIYSLLLLKRVPLLTATWSLRWSVWLGLSSLLLDFLR